MATARRNRYGSEEILAWAAPDCRRLTIPALYDDGLYPFQLGSLRTPLEPSVIAALELAASPRADWGINGETVALENLLAVHLAWYDDHPDLVQAGLSQHEGRLWLLGMA